VIAQPDKPAGRGLKLHKPPVAVRASEAGILLLQPSRIRDDGFLQEFAALNVDIAVVVAYGKILPANLLAMPKHGFINVHGSLLPHWRGAAPIQRSIEAGERETGITIMRVDEQLDHGPMLRLTSITIGDEETSPELASRLAELGALELVTALDSIEGETSREIEQDHAKSTYASKISKEEGVIDWVVPAKILYDRWRAFQPWPGLSFSHANEVIKVTRLSSDSHPCSDPGLIDRMDGSSVSIATGNGSLEVLELQRPGKRSTAAAEVLRSLGLGIGARIQ